MQPGAAQEIPNPGLRLNHVGIYTKDYDESMRFYTETVGFREAFTIKDKDGKPTLTYLQVTKDTFIELAPATAERPAGLSHIGFSPVDLNATMATCAPAESRSTILAQGRRKPASRMRSTPAASASELLDFLPDSLPRKAMDSWK